MPDVELKIDKWEDKSDWGEGPWQEEPDRVAWTDPDTGFPCIIRRGTSGAWCGYVGVGEGHPFYGRSYDDVPVEVHGGLTYGEYCNEDDKERGVCHVAPWKAYWFGFDCAHSGDAMPGLEARVRQAKEKAKLMGRELPPMPPDLLKWKEEYPDHYWTMGQVMMETHHLAFQLNKIAND